MINSQYQIIHVALSFSIFPMAFEIMLSLIKWSGLLYAQVHILESSPSVLFCRGIQKGSLLAVSSTYVSVLSYFSHALRFE